MKSGESSGAQKRRRVPWWRAVITAVAWSAACVALADPSTQPGEEGPPAALAPAGPISIDAAAEAAGTAVPPATLPSFVPEAARSSLTPPAATPAEAAAAAAVPEGAQSTSITSPLPSTPPVEGEVKPSGLPAKQLFGAAKSPAPLAARAIGTYAKGCLAGATALATDGPAWQAMRLSRNRNWGHPELVALVERLANEAKAHDGWPGLLVGDLSQPRGGPMLTGHASHQVGLDADIWFTPMPDRRLSDKEREELSATSMLGEDELSVRADVWTDAHLKLVKRAASYAQVERVLVHPAIKNLMCHQAGSDRAWLGKVRPIWGHYYHFHVRIGCPKGSTGCVSQAPPPGDDGCGKELVDWYQLLIRSQQPAPPTAKPAQPKPPKPPMTLAELPAECRVVLDAGTEREGIAREGTAMIDKAAVPATGAKSTGNAAKALAKAKAVRKEKGERKEKSARSASRN